MITAIGAIHFSPAPGDPFGDLEMDVFEQEPPADLNKTVDEAAAESLLESIRAVAPELEA